MIREYQPQDQLVVETIGNRIKPNYKVSMNDFTNTLVYELNQHILGFVVYSIVGDIAEIIDIAVTKDEEGKGLGSKLIESVMKKVEESGLHSISLEVREDNERAIQFYEREGFKKSHLRKQYYSDSTNAIFMIKEW